MLKKIKYVVVNLLYVFTAPIWVLPWALITYKYTFEKATTEYIWNDPHD